MNNTWPYIERDTIKRHISIHVKSQDVLFAKMVLML